MKKIVTILAGLMFAGLAMSGLADASTAKKSSAAVQINVDISDQSMLVKVNGWPYGYWKVSTARDGYYAPRGAWRPFSLKKTYYSRKYDNSPMPNSIFFLGGYAIHATYYVKQLGRPASHGCIRLHPKNAQVLYDLVKKYGLQSTRIVISN